MEQRVCRAERGLLTRRTFLGGAIAAGLAAPRRAPAQGKKARVRFWTFLNPKGQSPRERGLGQLLEGFAQKHPDIEVVIEPAPWQTVHTQLIQAAAAGGGPEVAMIPERSLFEVAAAGAVHPLNDLVAKWPKPAQEDFIAGEPLFQWKGAQLGFYWEVRLNGILWVRQDWLRDKGLKAPRTWDEVGAAGKAVASESRFGFAVGLGPGGTYCDLRSYLHPALWGFGGDHLHPDGTAAFHEEPGVRAFSVLADLANVHKVVPPGIATLDCDKTLDLFKAGRLAMGIQGTHRVSTGRAGAGVGENLQTAAIPSGDPEKPSPGQLAGQALMISRDAKEKEAGWRLLEYLVSPEAQLLNAKVAQQLPTRKSAYRDPFFQSPEARELVGWKEYIERASRVPAFPVQYNQLVTWLGGAAQQIVLAKAPVKPTLEEVARRWDREVAKK